MVSMSCPSTGLSSVLRAHAAMQHAGRALLAVHSCVLHFLMQHLGLPASSMTSQICLLASWQQNHVQHQAGSKKAASILHSLVLGQHMAYLPVHIFSTF